MPHYIVIRKNITTTGFFASNTSNPTAKELLHDLTPYESVYLLHSLEDARLVAGLFFHEPHPPKTSGSYAMIAEVTAEFPEDLQPVRVDTSVIYNNWIDSQRLRYIRQQPTEITVPSTTLLPEQIKSILRSHVPGEAAAHNPKLRSTDFTAPAPSRCCVM